MTDGARDPDDGVEALERSLGSELGLLRDLVGQFAEQRAALAADDTAALEQVVQQIGRTLLTLREARRQRAILMEMVTGEPGIGLAALLARVAPGRPALRTLGRDLHEAAVGAARELEINQTAIRRAIESGEQFLHSLLTIPGPGDPGNRPEAGLLLNQRA